MTGEAPCQCFLLERYEKLYTFHPQRNFDRISNLCTVQNWKLQESEEKFICDVSRRVFISWFMIVRQTTYMTTIFMRFLNLIHSLYCFYWLRYKLWRSTIYYCTSYVLCMYEMSIAYEMLANFWILAYCYPIL